MSLFADRATVMKRSKRNKAAKSARSKKIPRPDNVDTIQDALIRSSQEEELCEKLISKFARKSDASDDVGTVRLHYQQIVREFRCLRHTRRPPLTTAERKKLENAILSAPDQTSGDVVLEAHIAALRKGMVEHPSLQHQLSQHLKNDRSQKKFIADLNQAIRRYVYVRWQNDPPATKIHDIEFGSSLMFLLGTEWLRDPDLLSRFLEAVFRKWRTIDDLKNRWRYRTAMAHLAPKFRGDRKRLQSELEFIGLLPPSTNKLEPDVTKELKRIGKFVSRHFGNQLQKPPRGDRSTV